MHKLVIMCNMPSLEPTKDEFHLKKMVFRLEKNNSCSAAKVG